MSRKMNGAVLAGTLAFVLVSSLVAQRASDAAPIPSQINSAKKVFISNTVGDDLHSDDPAQVYSAFYAAVKGWGHYELVTTPAAADLVFEISFREPIVAVAVAGSATNNAPVGGSYSDPHLRLVILDPKTRISLWWFTAHVRAPLFSSEKSLDRPIAELMGQLKQITRGGAAE